MKLSDYIEGQKATDNFEEGMKAIFKVPKKKAAKAAKKNASSRPSRLKKLKRADEN